MENFVVDSKWVKENYHREARFTIPDGAVKIEEQAFEGCKSLISVTIPDGVTSIGANAFEKCEYLKSVTIPDSVTSIGDYAFAHCGDLTSVTIPGSVKEIGYKAFEECEALASTYIEEGVTSIRKMAFSKRDSYGSVVNYVHIPNSVTHIGMEAFSKEVNHTGTPQKIIRAEIICEPGSFAERYAQANGVTCHYEGEFIDYAWACRNYDEQTGSVVIPETAKAIGRNAFTGMGVENKVYIPDNIQSIHKLAFSDSYPTIVCSLNSVAEQAAMRRGLKIEYTEEVEKAEETKEAPTTEESAASLRASMDELFATVQSQQEMIASLQEQLAKVTEQMRQPSQEEKKKKPQKENAPAKTSSKDAQKRAWGDWRKRYKAEHDKTDR